MKAIKVTAVNLEAISAQLEEVNGKATTHTYTAQEILALADQAGDAYLKSLGLPKTMWAGARLTALSGDACPKAYKYPRKATLAVLERRASGWFLVRLAADTVYPQGGYVQVRVTSEQKAEAVRRFAADIFTADCR